jgi:hypothetical protein
MLQLAVILLLAVKSVMGNIIALLGNFCKWEIMRKLLQCFCGLSVIESHKYFTAYMAKDHTAVSRGEPLPYHLQW